jgi:hypothetical protein
MLLVLCIGMHGVTVIWLAWASVVWGLRHKRETVPQLDEALHTFPVNDWIEHDISGEPCVCGPTAFPLGDGTWHIHHHSLDGREHHDPDHDRDSCPLCRYEPV